MEQLNGQDFFKTLKCLDIDTGSIRSESLDWLFDNKQNNSILVWLCTYIHENNVETYSESQKYATLQKDEIEVSSEYIDNIFNSNPKFSHILETDIQQINLIKKEIDNAKIKEDQICKLTSKYLSLGSSISSHTRKLQDLEINSKLKHQNYISECKYKGKKINDLHKSIDSIAEKVQSILSHCDKGENKHDFFCRIPLNMYKLHGESLITKLNLWIRKNVELNDTNNSNDLNYIESELNRMKYGIEESIINQIKSECAEKEVLGKYKYLRRNNRIPISFDNQRIQEIQITSRINTLHENLNRLYSDLQRSAEEYTMNLINTFQIKNAEIKLSKHRNTLKILKTMNDEVTHCFAQFMLTFLLLKTDKIQLQAINKFAEDIYFYSSKYLKHYSLRSELMNAIEKNVAKQKRTLLDSFTLVTEKDSDDPVMNIIRDFEKQKIAIQNLENKLFITGNLKYWDTIKELKQNFKNVKNFIWCGPTKQPVIVPYEYLQKLSIATYQLEKVKKSVGSVMDDCTNMRIKLDKNRWLKYRRLIWVLFLNDPAKLNEIIENLKKYVTEQAKKNR